MMPSKSIVALVAACLALAAVGCSNQKGKGRTGTSAQFSFGSDSSAPKNAPKQQPAKNSRNQAVSLDGDGALSPEASVQRDLERLRQKEKEQVKNLKEMKDAMAQGSEIIRKEEERLAELRNQIDQFETAQRLYQQAAVTRGSRNEPATRTAGLDANEYERQYRAAPATYSANEYGPSPAESQYPANQARRDYPDARQLSHDGNYGQPQPYTETRAQPQTPNMRFNDDEPIWSPPERLFSQAPAPSMGSASPARPAQQPRPAPQSFPTPPQPRTRTQPAPEKPAGVNMGANTIDDDIFTPDLFLSGGK